LRHFLKYETIAMVGSSTGGRQEAFMAQDKKQQEFTKEKELSEEKLDKVSGGTGGPRKDGVTITSGGSVDPTGATVVQNNP
jgi:bacteriocin-like protein